MKNALDKNCRENQNTFYAQQRLSKNRTVYEIMSKIMVQSVSSQFTVWCMRIACWITNDRDT